MKQSETTNKIKAVAIPKVDFDAIQQMVEAVSLRLYNFSLHYNIHPKADPKVCCEIDELSNVVGNISQILGDSDLFTECLIQIDTVRTQRVRNTEVE